MAAKKKDPGWWSTSSGGQRQTGGTWGVQDSYAQRNRRKEASGQACSSLLILGLGLVALGWFLNSAAGWVL